MRDILRSLFMNAAHRPVAAAGILLAAMAGSLFFGLAMGSCQTLGGKTRETTPIAKRDPVTSTGDIYKLTALTGEPEMRVRVAAGAPRATFDGVDGFWIGPVGDRTSAEMLSGAVQVALMPTHWVATTAGGAERVWERDADLEIAPVTAKQGEAGWARMNGVKYAGTFRLIAPPMPAATTASGRGRSSGMLATATPTGAGVGGAGEPVGFDVVEYIKIEEYLPGVIAKELYQNWSLPAFKTQAITARSYAIHERQRSMAAGRKFDVEATTQDQAYGGATGLPVAVRAVAETRGQVLEFGGSVLRAYYSSTCGGRAASARDTWPVDKGYEFNLAGPIQGLSRPFACEESPLFRWTVERPKSELVKRLAAYGAKNGYIIRQIKDLAKLEVLSVNATGRPSEYKVVEPGGKWYPLKAEELRLACNTDYPGAPPITRQTRINSGDLEFAVQGSSVTITGRGFGHGVGMCQYCAQAMGSKGEDPVKMLERFYPGAKVVRAY